jgi:hypothetical protein
MTTTARFSDFASLSFPRAARALRVFLALLPATFFAQSATQPPSTTPAPSTSAIEAPPKPDYSTDEADYPHLIKASLWPASDGFRRGDKVTITSIRGTLPKIKPGGIYLVQGTYTLASEVEGSLALSLTTSGGGGGAWANTQVYKIEKGSGTFVLAAKMASDGQYHVSLYLPDRSAPVRKDKKGNPLPARNHSQGGIYFDNR